MLRPSDISPLSRLLQRVDAATDGHPSGDSFATGFPSVDRWLGGGVRRGDLICIGGEVGCGKSSLALAMALRMAQAGTTAAFLTAEMSVERVLERALTIEGRAKVDEVRAGTLDEPSRATVGAAALRLRDHGPALGNLPTPVPGAIGELLRRTLDLEVVFVDPLQALALGERPLEEELATAVRSLKQLALDLDVAVVLTTHLAAIRPERDNPRPTLGDLGALGAITQHADIVMGIFREEMYRPDAGVEGATELIILKNRNGSLGYVDLYFYKQWLRFEDMLDPDR